MIGNFKIGLIIRINYFVSSGSKDNREKPFSEFDT